MSRDFAHWHPDSSQVPHVITGIVRDFFWYDIEAAAWQRQAFLLQAYAIHGLALWWMSNNISDGFLLGVPQEREAWQVEIVSRRTRNRVGMPTLDRQGEVLTDAAALRESLTYD